MSARSTERARGTLRAGSVEWTKRCVIGKATPFPTSNLQGDYGAACRWDCYRRASMLEPLAADVFARGVPGDFLEAGVFKGGIAIVMTALLVAHDPLGSRRMWVADSFEGLPEPAPIPDPEIAKLVRDENSSTKWVKGRFAASLTTVKRHFGACSARKVTAMTTLDAEGRALPIVGYFRDSLPGPVTQLSILRIGADTYGSVTDVLERLYDLLSHSGYVVFDDFNFARAHLAIYEFRQRRDILEPLLVHNRTIDPIVYWQKGGPCSSRL